MFARINSAERADRNACTSRMKISAIDSGMTIARRFIARYFSDPRAMGASMASHFVELIEDGRAARSA